MHIAKGLIGSGLVLGILLSGCGGGGGGGTDGATSTGSPAAPASAESRTGQVTIAWDSAPTDMHGACTVGIQGYRINLGLSPGLYSRTDFVGRDQLICSAVGSTACGNIERCSYTISGLTTASWYISVQSVDLYGGVSAYSDPVVATVYVN
ncbi:MAG: hypothetical protein WCZ87_02325 [Thiohalobacteraceae bacterium]